MGKSVRFPGGQCYLEGKLRKREKEKGQKRKDNRKAESM
jgi:hypothetical protein